MTRPSTSVFVAMLALGPAGAAEAQGTSWFDSYRTASIYLENDALAKWRSETTDESYTQGLRFTWDFAVWPDWAGTLHHRLSLLSPFGFNQAFGACTPQRTRAAGPCGTVTLGLGQTIYTPRDITSARLQPQDQPYAGWLFGTLGVTARHGRWQSGTELVAGVIGPPSIARDTQSLAHWTWSQGSARPAGWDNQLRTSVHAGLWQQYSVHLVEACLAASGCSSAAGERRVFDLTPRVEFAGTTTMARATAGLTVRAGHGFPDRLGQRIPATGRAEAQRSFWWSVFATADQRWVPYNAFLEGTYADGGSTGWRAKREIAPRRLVNEFGGGITLGTAAFTVSVQAVNRSLEWDPVLRPGQLDRDRGRHSYLSLTLALNQGR